MSVDDGGMMVGDGGMGDGDRRELNVDAQSTSLFTLHPERDGRGTPADIETRECPLRA
jgi:hypothetical protein